ncbi:carbohydrate ABC transporter permease [Microbacterium trichothecenolyticum]|uniref:Carbohydrate ABC transporter permease n=1 Tax=Microbacterium ureisolvens TaxID=2781186 RepID=A0ABS7HX74_9MICO|nr:MULTISPECIES: carbohydrate ABC transporter permease [Microbacterium]MBW9109216.1 carbohydrate ABC transporter permease [Microbacterium ureisolvens]MBW9120133.1 carbohydrate ABC transporter permease [Microbacterium trichothecenolyticum]
MRTTSRPSVGRILAWVYLIAILLITIFPFYWILRTALSDNYALLANPSSILPVDFTWGPFRRVLGLATPEEALAEGGSGASIQLGRYIFNSVIYATLSTGLIVFFSTIAAYAFARLQWKGRELVFSLFLAALMVPGILTLLPNFVLVKELGLLNTFAGMILPYALFSAFNIFFLRQFMLGLSTETEEAALIDGAGRVRILFGITLPMTSGPIVTLSILGFIGMWNDYFWPLLVTSDESVQPLTLALAVFKQASPQSQPDWAGLMAATLVAAAPMLVLFMVFGKRIVNSIGFTGLK